MLQSTSNIVLDPINVPENPVDPKTKLKVINTTAENYKTKSTRRASGGLDCNHCKQTYPRPRLQSVPEIKVLQKRASNCYYQYVQAQPLMPPPRPIAMLSMMPPTMPISVVDQQPRVYAPIRHYHHPPPTYLSYRSQYCYVQRYYPQCLYYRYLQYQPR